MKWAKIFNNLAIRYFRISMGNWKVPFIMFLILFIFGFSRAQTGAIYLVIYHDMFNPAIKPLVEWKTKKGVKALGVPLSQTGSTPAQIKSYIQNAFNTWLPTPEYVLLVGSPDLLPSYLFNYFEFSDDYYADMTGDYQIELCIGRFHCATLAQCSLMVAKTIGYEKSKTMHDSTWFTKGTTIIHEDVPPDPYYQSDARLIRDLWLTAGYTHVDSFISTNPYHNQDSVVNAINDGRAFVVYRGQTVGSWWQPFNVDPNQTSNGYKLPIVVSGTCATLTLSPGENMLGDAFQRAGTVQNPKGAVAFFGTSWIGSGISMQRGTVTRAFFQTLFQESVYTIGGATKQAKLILDFLFHDQERYMEWNLLGDPELNVWTQAPQLLSVTHDTIIFIQPTDFSLSVSCSGEPVSNALVCVMMDSTIYNYGYTDSAGLVIISFTPQHVGTLQITVTGRNYFPYEDSISVQPVGIEERSTLDALSLTPEIYPKPAKSFLTIRLPCTADRTKLKIFDVSGKLIKAEEKITSAQEQRQEVKISLKGINPGIYFLRLGKETKKFLVAK